MLRIHIQKKFMFAFVFSFILTLSSASFAHANLFAQQNFDLQNSKFIQSERVTEQTVVKDQTDPEEARDIVETARSNESLQTFMNLFDELGMTEDLRGYGRFTVFMPNDDAFRVVEDELQNYLQVDRSGLATLLSYHILSDSSPLTSEEMTSSMTVRTLAGHNVEITRRRGKIYVNNAQIIEKDILASNGIIHIINEVIVPSDE
jgi:uncharacterized surface protein with fasciclin (FAS1) repeats